MNRIINAILLQDVRTEAEWSSANPVVEKDKICYSSDKGNYKIGNGTSHWSELKYNHANALDVPAWAKQSTKPSYTKAEVGLSNVENKSSETIRSELTKANVVNALGYTPPTTNTTYAVFGGATQDKAGTIGLVPAPIAGSNSNRFLKADGTWAIPPNTTYNVATQTSNGLMSSTDKTKLDGIQTGANNYTHPAYTERSSGLYKITVDNKGHVSTVVAVAKSDITALGIPSTDTKYGVATSEVLGLVKSGGDITIGSDGLMTVENDSHSHSNSTITSLDASKLTGTIDIARLPKGALERLVKVANKAERFKLTTATVQLGDTVQELDTKTMYIVIDEANLASEAGYTAYTAGSASSVPWSGITGKPSTFTPSTHTHTISQISDISSARVAYATSSGSATKATQDSAGQQINTTYIKGISISGRTVTITKGDGTTTTQTTQDTNTTYANFKGATSALDGTSGLVIAPTKGLANRYLRSDGTWAVPPDTNTTYGVATQSANGLMSSTDKTKLDGIQSGAQKNTITGIKGNAESSYRTGNVNITPADIGAANASHSHTSANISDLYSKIYPVGIILPFANSSDPNTLFTGTEWTKVAPGRVLIGAGTLSDGSVSKTFTPGTTGGKYQAKLTTANMPAHTHSVSVNVKRESITTGSGSTTGYIPATGVQGSATYSSSGSSGSAGSGSGFDTLPPYFPVYLWQRTS